MSHRGTITLLTKGDEPLVVLKYDCVPDRKKIIAQWSRLYGGRFAECQIAIDPVVDFLKVRNDGTNGKEDRIVPVTNEKPVNRKS